MESKRITIHHLDVGKKLYKLIDDEGLETPNKIPLLLEESQKHLEELSLAWRLLFEMGYKKELEQLYPDLVLTFDSIIRWGVMDLVKKFDNGEI